MGHDDKLILVAPIIHPVGAQVGKTDAGHMAWPAPGEEELEERSCFPRASSLCKKVIVAAANLGVLGGKTVRHWGFPDHS